MKGKISESKGEKKKSKNAISQEDKEKLAGFLKEEDVIYNLQNKLHSNGPAVAAAWNRIATKMDKSGKNE